MTDSEGGRIGNRQLDNAQRLAWLRLIRSENVGPITFGDLLKHFGSAAAAIDAIPDLAARGGRAIRICDPDDAEQELATLEHLGGRLVALGEAEYPAWLAHIDSAPPLVSVRGDLSVLSRPMVAIVGSRNASIAGTKFAKQIARDLGKNGYVVVSGLARGIDAAAHEASLESGTVAVLAGGLDRIYPPDNAELAEAILEKGGAHVTEMPLGWAPRARDFPRRNRIVSGVAVGAVIVEAAMRSGSLVTARLAGEQGRLVFAVPGSPLDPRAAGTNRLIRDGAHILTGVDDIIGEIEPMLGSAAPAQSYVEEAAPPMRPRLEEAGSADRDRIVAALGPAPVEMDDVIRFTGLAPASVHLILLELDLAGRLARHPGGRVSLLASDPV